MWELIKFLGQRHHLEFACVTAHQPDPLGLKEYCREVHLLPLGKSRPTRPCPKSVAPFCGSDLEEPLRRIAQQSYDVVLIDRIYLAFWHYLFQQPVILCEHNVESSLLRQFAELQTHPGKRLAWRGAALELEAFEREMWPRFFACCMVSEADKTHCSGKGEVVPNGADCSHPMVLSNPARPRALFSGLLDYLPNREAVLWLAREIMPRVWEHREDLRLVAAGAHPDEELRRLAQTDHRLELQANPPDMRAVAEQCTMLLVPLRHGAGTRIKILEAFAWGLPVISTTLGQQGLGAEVGKHLWIADDAENFARSILQLASDDQTWNDLRRNARRYCEEKYDWRRVLSPLDELIRSACGAP